MYKYSHSHWWLWVVAATLLPLVGCKSNNKMALVEALQRYNDGVRWQRTDEVLQYLPGPKRNEYVSRLQSMRDLRVTNCQIDSVRLKGTDQAYVVVRIEWYSMRTAQVYRTQMRQSWSRTKGQWHVADQRWIRGETFPLFARSASTKAPATARQ